MNQRTSTIFVIVGLVLIPWLPKITGSNSQGSIYPDQSFSFSINSIARKANVNQLQLN